MGNTQPRCCRAEGSKLAAERAEEHGDEKVHHDVSDSISEKANAQVGMLPVVQEEEAEQVEADAQEEVYAEANSRETEEKEEEEAAKPELEQELQEQITRTTEETQEPPQRAEGEEAARLKAEEEEVEAAAKVKAEERAAAKAVAKTKTVPKKKAAVKSKAKNAVPEPEPGFARVIMPAFAKKTVSYYTPEEVAEHNSEKSLWLIMNRKVYDVTKFHKYHPGGKDVILNFGGKDATAAANAAHNNALPGNLMKEFVIGSVKRAPRVDAPLKMPASADDGYDVTYEEEGERWRAAWYDQTGSRKMTYVPVKAFVQSNKSWDDARTLAKADAIKCCREQKKWTQSAR
eukprot:gnl/TRDRNA2_/TRDRNA2_202685_c0_seq1.p1 gnl/TRDRNA2_/TRDRNA2_202685_c0~~gnl/TRDRNA2_/TRDRNA2_202685_c0_seq1.p1  ORF type:complete len:345 (+),score=112.05 gnl/TRDRNA2_/TRDRNA2_202685_c0_seq1:59-1093(+)